MINRRACLTSLALSLACAPAVAEGQARGLDDDLEELRARYGLPALAAAVVKQGTIVSSGVVGVRALGSDVKAAIDDRFHLGSDTKAMTATLAGMLIDEGRLAWDATIGDILSSDVPGLNARLAVVTLEQLLSHSGGIPSDTPQIARLYYNTDVFELNLPPLRLKTLSAWKSHPPISRPGAAFHYANLGYLIAGAMIEKAAGRPWEALITDRIFTPLGLKTAGLGPQATRGRLDAPVGHDIDDAGRATPMYWGPAADIPPMLGPAGVAHMSVLDFGRWAGWNAGGGKRGPALVKPETLERIHRPHIKTGKLPNARPGTPQEGEYALGWGVIKFDWSRAPLLTHNGSNSMNFARISVDREADLAVVVTTNFPEKKAEDATYAMTERLYRRHI